MEQNVETVQPVTTRGTGVKFGLYSALAGIALFMIAAVSGMNPFGGPLNWLGIAITIGLLFMAQKSFKDSGDGFMTYGQGVGIGFWFTLASAIVGVAFMYVYGELIDTSVMDSFYEEQQAKMEEQGQSDEAINIAMTWTKKLFWVFAFIGSLFWGMIIALILTIFTQKKPAEQTF